MLIFISIKGLVFRNYQGHCLCFFEILVVHITNTCRLLLKLLTFFKEKKTLFGYVVILNWPKVSKACQQKIYLGLGTDKRNLVRV